jgi:hypothetical protein
LTEFTATVSRVESNEHSLNELTDEFVDSQETIKYQQEQLDRKSESSVTESIKV